MRRQRSAPGAARTTRPTRSVWERATLGDVATALEARDRIDRTRSVSPLTAAEDAVEIDTTGLSIDDVIERVLGLVAESLKSDV